MAPTPKKRRKGEAAGVPAFVRVPATVRRRLKACADLRGTTMERLLEEILDRALPVFEMNTSTPPAAAAS